MMDITEEYEISVEIHPFLQGLNIYKTEEGYTRVKQLPKYIKKQIDMIYDFGIPEEAIVKKTYTFKATNGYHIERTIDAINQIPCCYMISKKRTKVSAEKTKATDVTGATMRILSEMDAISEQLAKELFQIMTDEPDTLVYMLGLDKEDMEDYEEVYNE